MKYNTKYFRKECETKSLNSEIKLLEKDIEETKNETNQLKASTEEILKEEEELKDVLSKKESEITELKVFLLLFFVHNS